MDKKLILRRMRKSAFFMTGLIVACLIVLLAAAAPILTDYDPTANSLTDILKAPEFFANGLQGHVLGTDEMGRDVLARLLYGARYSLVIAVVVVALSCVIGTLLGLLAGYIGGVVDPIIMRMTEVFMAIPQLVFAIAVVAVLGANVVNLVIVCVITCWPQYCKLTRNNVLVVKNQDFVHASQIMGGGRLHIILTQILPNVTTSLLITISQQVGQVILFEASLSFLSLGIPKPLPSWGNMIAAGRTYLTTCPWMVIAPGVALMLTVLAFNFLGDGLRDVLDPKRT